MCPPNCLQAVCKTATRRGLLKSGFTLGLGGVMAAAGLATSPRQAEAQRLDARLSFFEITDLSHTLYEGFPTFSSERWFEMEHPVTWAKDGVNLNRWILMEHSGTHLDAPIHSQRTV